MLLGVPQFPTPDSEPKSKVHNRRRSQVQIKMKATVKEVIEQDPCIYGLFLLCQLKDVNI